MTASKHVLPDVDVPALKRFMHDNPDKFQLLHSSIPPAIELEILKQAFLNGEVRTKLRLLALICSIEPDAGGYTAYIHRISN